MQAVIDALAQLFGQVGTGFLLGIVSTAGVAYFGRDRWLKYVMRADEYADAIDQVTDQLKSNVDVDVDNGKSEPKVSGGSGKGN